MLILDFHHAKVIVGARRVLVLAFAVANAKTALAALVLAFHPVAIKMSTFATTCPWWREFAFALRLPRKGGGRSRLSLLDSTCPTTIFLGSGNCFPCLHQVAVCFSKKGLKFLLVLLVLFLLFLKTHQVFIFHVFFGPLFCLIRLFTSP
jgi:hypothetical protein